MSSLTKTHTAKKLGFHASLIGLLPGCTIGVCPTSWAASVSIRWGSPEPMPLASAGSLAAWKGEAPLLLVEGKQLPRAVDVNVSAGVAGLWQCDRLPIARGHPSCKLVCMSCQDRATSDLADRANPELMN